MKILFVDVHHEYGDQSRGINHIGVQGFVAGFASLGHKVETFYYDVHLRPFAERVDDRGLYRRGCVRDWGALQKALIDRARQVSPDLVLFNLYTGYFTIETLDELMALYPTANFFGDDPFLFDSFTRHYCGHFTHCFSTDKYSIARYPTAGAKAVSLTQWGVVDTGLEVLEDRTIYDVSFVGAKNPERAWFVHELRQRGISVEVFGNGWGTRRLSDAEMAEVFARSKISLNLSNNGTHDIRFLLSPLRSIGSIAIALAKVVLAGMAKKRDRIAQTPIRKTSQIKGRNFEIPFHGGFQLTDYVPGIEDYFVIGQEIICYKNVDEAALLIQHFLNNDDVREAIRRAGNRRAVTSGYTYRDICAKMLADLSYLNR